ncbi:MAG: glycosyltransferase, partial [Candidatus Aenigmarchaeota archaeon]|nr:glycosyltransferase [Candidatus Aenigmarchaeota archaeon]
MLKTILEAIIALIFAIVSAWAIYNTVLFFAGLFSRLKKNTQLLDGEMYESKVSIIIPVKNGEKVLPRLIDSLLNLDYSIEKMEVILVEDGSSDKSYEL